MHSITSPYGQWHPSLKNSRAGQECAFSYEHQEIPCYLQQGIGAHGGQFQSNLYEEFYRDIISIQERECEEILTNATVKLEEHFRETNSRLQTLIVRGATMLGEDATIQTNIFEDMSAAQGGHQVILA